MKYAYGDWIYNHEVGNFEWWKKKIDKACGINHHNDANMSSWKVLSGGVSLFQIF
jgi:hypothetical protein